MQQRDETRKKATTATTKECNVFKMLNKFLFSVHRCNRIEFFPIFNGWITNNSHVTGIAFISITLQMANTSSKYLQHFKKYAPFYLMERNKFVWCFFFNLWTENKMPNFKFLWNFIFALSKLLLVYTFNVYSLCVRG